MLREQEVKLCENCWKNGYYEQARWFPHGYPLCDHCYGFVCQRCQRNWRDSWRELCSDCRELKKHEDARRVDYDAHLNSRDWWKTKRQLKRQSFREHGSVVCAKCGMTEIDNKNTYGEGLHGHHKTYGRFRSEELEDVELLCSECHAREHGRPRPRPLSAGRWRRIGS